ncbi:hypothetical protein [Lysobacter silvisoli]|uniref:Uncharacterized protein n=1 Tax=Lysobacter silvisoli TaxID=2293254 RepID=A0A371K3G7_9GAMM|nr:hypothetical protein [Lysobacter silvisoli]RDZ28400.1 hypothetical protein DX914_04485 [Lysobacter silvisoli]
MNRKLHNSISALLATGGTLVLALVAANPALPEASAVPTLAAQVAAAPMPVEADALVRSARLQAQRLEARVEQADSLAEAAALTAELVTAAALADALGTPAAAESADNAVPQRKVRKAKQRSRQALVMPYFSFAPRG